MHNYILDLSVFYRGIFAGLTSVTLMILLGGSFIKLVKNYTQPIREEGIQAHLAKKNTPTFGGVLMVFVFLISILIWVKFNLFVANIIFVGIGFAALGFADDFLKLKNKSSKGVSGKLRLLIGFIIGGIAGYVMIHVADNQVNMRWLFFPFIKYFYINMHGLIYAWIAFVIVGTANSVNLSDGLDGLSSKLLITIFTAFAIILCIYYLHSFNHTVTSKELANYNYLIRTKLNEIFVILTSLIGVLLGFLWYNSAPAKIFMGDVGSLFLGGILGAIATSLKHELVLLISGIILVLESCSVILQVYYYKLTKKRLFLMAPLHHHFEKKGIAETTIVDRFWIITIIMSLVSIILIKFM
ncbi:phospho-N-acetylmuramoyl-pentapeptide-transferase [Rickettsiales bacterium LUAb2]